MPRFIAPVHIAVLAIAAVLGCGCADSVTPIDQPTDWANRGSVLYTRGLSLLDTGRIHMVDLDGTNDHSIVPGAIPCAPVNDRVVIVANTTFLQWSLSIARLADPSTPTLLAFGTGDQISAASFSPDGSRIAYVLSPFRAGGSDSSRLCIINADGTGKTVIARDVLNSAVPVFSPNGDRLAYYAGHGGDSIAITDLTSGASTVVARNARPWSIESLDWSPDGEWLVYVGANPSGRALYVVDTAGTLAVNITPPGAVENRWPVWSPDGSMLAFVRDGDLYAMHPDGSGLRRLTNGSASQFGIVMYPTWSPDCAMVLFTCVAANPAQGLLQVADLATGRINALTTSAARGFWYRCVSRPLMARTVPSTGLPQPTQTVTERR